MKFAISLVVLFMHFSAISKRITLEELKTVVEKNSYELQAKNFEHQALINHRDADKASFYPTFGVKTEYEWLDTDLGNDSETKSSIYGKYNLFNGNKDVNHLKIANLKVNSSTLSQKSIQLDKRLFIEELYYRYIYISKKIQTNIEEINRLKKLGKIVRKRYESKLITQSDLLDFELGQKKSESDNYYLMSLKDRLHSDLVELAGFSSEEKYSFEGDLPHLKILEENLSDMENLNSSPSLKQLSIDYDISEKSISMQKSSWLPRIDLTLDYGQLNEYETGVSSDKLSTRVLLEASWNFFSGFETSNLVKAEVNDSKAIAYKRKMMTRSVKIEVNNNFKMLKVLEKTIDLEELNEKKATKLYNILQREYRKGVKSFETLSSSNKELSRIKNRVYELKYQYIKHKIELEKNLGRSLKFKTVFH